MIPSSIYHVDLNVLKLNSTETGRLTAPFHSVQQAIDDGYKSGFSSIEILVAGGFYPDLITIPANIVVVVKGGISGICILGDVIFNAYGKFNPIVGKGTACSFNDVIIQSLTINDFDISIPAEHSVFITQNSSIVGDVIQTGRSFMSVFFAGIGTANAVLDGVVQSSQVLGNISVPYGNVSATNTSFSGTLLANQIYCSGCDLAEFATAPNGIECHQCILDGTLSSKKIYLDDISFNQVVTKNIKLSSTPVLLGNSNVAKITPVNKDYQILISDQLIVVDDNHDKITLLLPTNPYSGLQFDIIIYDGYESLTIKGDGKKINGQDEFQISNQYDHIKFTYIGADKWLAK